jgi:transposase-like protein
VGNGTVYSEAFRTKMVQRMLSPNARSMRVIAREAGVPEGTLYRWRNEATLATMSGRSTDDPPRSPAQSPQDWTAEEKLAVVLEAASVPDAELGAYLRTKGVHEAQLREWRQQALSGLQGKRERPASDDARRVRQLERELNRKDKALAEAAALLVLKKKAQAIWGDEDDDTDPKNDK